MKLVKQFFHNRKYVKRLLITLIILYPFIGAFLGLDLGDTGYHLYAYTNLVSNPDKINYTTYLSSAVGFLWNQMFGSLGLIAFNLLEVFLEWGIVFMVYRTFRKELGEIEVLAGSLMAVVAADGYLNIFNYHQFNAFLLTAILCLEYTAITKRRKRLSLCAGVLYVLVVFSRVGSVVAIVTCGLYIYHAVMNNFSYRSHSHRALHKKVWKETGMHLLYFAVGTAAAGLFLILCLVLTGRSSYFISNIFRLGDIASDNSTSYGFVNLLKSLIGDNLKVIASGLIFYGASGLFACGVNITLRRCRTKEKKVFCILLGVFVGCIGLYQMYFAFNVNPAENWPQMTTGQRFLIGVMYVTAFICYLYHAFKKDLHSQRMSLLVIASCMLVILTIAGSNTGTKHVILAMWLIAPVCVYTVKNMIFSETTAEYAGELFEKFGMKLHPLTLRSTAVVALAMFFLKFGHMAYYTFNYDDVNRTKLTAAVNNSKVKGILTTRREADALNGVLEVLERYDKDQPMTVFGNSLLFYYMTDRDSYGVPWPTQISYPLERYQEDLKKAEKQYGDTLPLVVYCRTNYSYGFGEETLMWNQQEITESLYSGKKEYFLEFLEKNDYGIEYMDDYYAVIVPHLTKDMKGLENILFGW